MKTKTYCGKSGQPPRNSEAWCCTASDGNLLNEYQCASCRDRDAGIEPPEHDPAKMIQVNRSGKATKHNAGKAQWGLLLADFQEELHEMIKVRQYGIEKYEKENWKLPLPEKDFFTDPAIRHIILAQQGAFFDAKSKLPHLAHAAMSCIMALWHEIDKRPNE